MGLFSKETIVTVATSVTRVLEDDRIPNSVRAGMIQGLLSDDGNQLTENVLEQVTNSMGILANRAYRYGRDNYVNGLPDSTFLHTGQGESVARAIIETIENKQVTIDYYHFGALNNQHVGWQHLVTNYGYDQATNELTGLSTLKGFPVYLEDFQVAVKDATPEELRQGSLAQWGPAATEGPTPLRKVKVTSIMGFEILRSPIPATPLLIDSTAVGDYFILSCIWRAHIPVIVDGKTVIKKDIQRERITFPMPVMDKGKPYFHAKYTYADPDTYDQYETLIPGKKYVRYFTYQEDTGTYPELDNLFSPTFSDLGSFYPFAYFRLDKTSLAEDPESTQYKHSKKLVGILSLPYDQIVEAIDENPDIDDVESALLMMAVPAETTNPVEQRYLFEFFNRMYLNTGAVGADLPTYTLPFIMSLPAQKKPPKISVVIQDATFKMAVSATAIRKFTKVGVKGVVDQCFSGTGTETAYLEYQEVNPENIIDVELIPSSWEVKYHYYIKQVSAAIYEEVRVYDLQTSYYVWRKYAASQTKDYKDNLLIPIDFSITDEFNIKEREELCARGLHYVINSLYITELEWYEQDWFTTFVMMAAFVWTVITLGADGGTFAKIASAIATMTVEQLIVYLLVQVAIAVATSLAFKLFVKAVGVKFALILAVVLAAAGMYDAIKFGNIKGAPWAETLLSTSSNLIKAVNSETLEDMLDLQADASDFMKEMKEQYKLLDEANELLENKSLLSPFLVFGESPQDFYTRTVHSGNIGVLGIEAISSYVDISLTLPKLSQTISFDQPMLA